MGSDTQMQMWGLESPLELLNLCPFLQIFSVPDGSGGPCLSLQPVWSPGERDQPGGREYSKSRDEPGGRDSKKEMKALNPHPGNLKSVTRSSARGWI